MIPADSEAVHLPLIARRAIVLSNRHRPLAALAVSVLGVVIALSGAIAANADDPVQIEFDDAALSIEYGTPWSFSFSDNGTISSLDNVEEVLSATISNAPSDFAVIVSAYRDSPHDVTHGSVYAASDNRPLGAGTYEITVTVDPSDPSEPPTSSTAELIIEPAQLDSELRAVPDKARSDAVIISAVFRGEFASNFYSSDYSESPFAPGGTWTFTVTDDAGAVAYAEEISVDKADNRLGASTYWSGANDGTDYLVTATFSPSGATSDNFAITQPDATQFTGAPDPRQHESSDAPPPSSGAQQAPSGPGLPLWLLIVISLVIAGLAALVIVQIVKLRSSAELHEGNRS
jgi:hypothetical protein